MAVNYTPEITEEMVQLYEANPTPETVELLMEKYGKTKKSIIGKLAREGVYRRQVYQTKSGVDPVTKEQLAEMIGEHLGVADPFQIEGLEKAPKRVLQFMEKRLAEMLENS